MKICKLISNKSKILYDGIEGNMAEKYSVTIEKKDIIIKISEIVQNDFKNIKAELNEDDFNTIVNLGELKNAVPDYFKNYFSKDEYNRLKTNFNYYRTEYHLGLNYLIKDDYLLLFTYGEKQPLRWRLILESIWKIQS